jgi:hypothetical protein
MKTLVKLLIALFTVFAIAPISPSSADVNDFSFESFDATYEISVDEAKDNRPEMIVTEKLVALFPMVEQNRGIRRSIPLLSYQLFPGLIEVLSVTDEVGKSREFEQSEEEGFLNLAIKSSDDSYVFGKQTYIIKYKQYWVINDFDSGKKDHEFYWDVNGNGWLQDFGRVSATVILDPLLSENVVANSMRCYEGNFGSTGSCKVAQPSENTYVFTSTDLKATETQTIAIGFNSGVANVDGPQAADSPSWLGFLLALFALLAMLVWAIIYRVTQLRILGKDLFIVPQYQPPKEPDLAVSAFVSRKTSHLNQARVIELAIAKIIEIEQVTDGKKNNYILRRTSAEVSNQNHIDLLGALGISAKGSEVNLSDDMDATNQAALSRRLLKLRTKIAQQVNSGRFFKKRALGIPALVFLVVLATFGALTVFATNIDLETAGSWSVIPILLAFPYFITYWLILSKRVLTAKGAQVEAHVKGMKMYIELAEKDRLDFLQSPKGASLKPSEVEGRSVLRLYEEVLPWAILLGLHKQWNAVLNDLYEKDGSPVWFIGVPVFSESFTGLDRVLAQSLSVDSSGGSGGGGSAGGGSGGGGGGGI